jgi:hypothetical protein
MPFVIFVVLAVLAALGVAGALCFVASRWL